jgi:hypothetical protein
VADLEPTGQQLSSLRRTLEAIVATDGEQEIKGAAVLVLDGVLRAAREVVPDNPTVKGLHDVVSVESVLKGEPLRAVDALLVTDQLIGSTASAADDCRQRCTIMGALNLEVHSSRSRG